MRSIFRPLFCALLIAIPCSLTAQTYTAVRVQFSHLGTFTQHQLEDAAGVHAGTSLDTAGLSAAAQRLVDTGYFDEMSATVDGKVTAATIIFDDKPTPIEHMLHVGFETSSG